MHTSNGLFDILKCQQIIAKSVIAFVMLHVRKIIQKLFYHIGVKSLWTDPEHHKLLYVSPEILVCPYSSILKQLDTLEKQLNPSGPIDSHGRSVLPSLKYVDDLKTVVRVPLVEFFGSAHDLV